MHIDNHGKNNYLSHRMGMSDFSPRKAAGPKLPLTFNRMKWFQNPRQGRILFPCPGGWKRLVVSSRFPRPLSRDPQHSRIPLLLGLVAKAPTVSQEEGTVQSLSASERVFWKPSSFVPGGNSQLL